MKRRWTVLFCSALGALMGMSWLAHSLGISLISLVTASLLGMIAASGVAFFAMIRDVREKWPAAVVLMCAGPMALEVIESANMAPMIFRYFGPSYGLVMVGTIATVVSAIAIVLMQPPAPPREPPVAPARVVD